MEAVIKQAEENQSIVVCINRPDLPRQSENNFSHQSDLRNSKTNWWNKTPSIYVYFLLFILSCLFIFIYDEWMIMFVVFFYALVKFSLVEFWHITNIKVTIKFRTNFVCGCIYNISCSIKYIHLFMHEYVYMCIACGYIKCIQRRGVSFYLFFQWWARGMRDRMEQG